MGGMCKEYFDCLNQLVEKGDHKFLESYILENKVTPQAYYKYLRSNQVFKNPSVVGWAAKCGNVNVLKTLLKIGFTVEEDQAHLDTIRPIHKACEGGSMAIVKMLVEEYGVDITDQYDSYYRPTMCVAAGNGHVEVLKYFLEKGVPVNQIFGRDNVTALHAAAERDQAETCEFLLSEGADVNFRDADGLTPLMYTAQTKSINSARVLLDAGAEVNLTDKAMTTAFLYAAVTNDLDMMKLLHSHGADPEICDDLSRLPLHIAIGGNYYDMACYLVNELNVALDKCEYHADSTGETPCSLALLYHDYPIARLIINAGYDPTKELAEYEDNGDADERKQRKWFLSETDIGQLQQLREMISRPRSLLALCTLTVRRQLGRRLPVDLDRLPLPEILKRAIMNCGDKKQNSLQN